MTVPLTEDVTARQWLAVAARVARGADCSRRQIGAVVVVGGVPVGVGHIETPPGTSCRGGDCPRGQKSFAEQPAYAPYGDCISSHAEAVALARARVTMGGEAALASGIIYVTDRPCHGCAALIERLSMFAVWERS